MVVLIAIVLPVWEAIEVPRLRKSCTTADRLRHYRWIIAAHVFLTCGAIITLGWRGVLTGGRVLDAATLAMHFPMRLTLLVLSLTCCLLALAPFLMGLIKPKIRIRYTKTVAKTNFSFMFPSTKIERIYFAVLSVSAGVCEEIIFRSFLIAYSYAFGMNVFWALAASSLLFGINHGYQGFSGIIKTAIGGCVFGLLFFTTGSIWIAMLLHAAIDASVLYNYRPDLVPSPSEIVQETSAAIA